MTLEYVNVREESRVGSKILRIGQAASLTHAACPPRSHAVQQGLDFGVFEEVGLALQEGLQHDADKVARVGQVAVMEEEPAPGGVRVLIEMIDAVRVEQRGPALDAVDLISLGQQELGKIGAVLARDPCDECFFQENVP